GCGAGAHGAEPASAETALQQCPAPGPGAGIVLPGSIRRGRKSAGGGCLSRDSGLTIPLGSRPANKGLPGGFLLRKSLDTGAAGCDRRTPRAGPCRYTGSQYSGWSRDHTSWTLTPPALRPGNRNNAQKTT